jgi:hypothetical protein
MCSYFIFQLLYIIEKFVINNIMRTVTKITNNPGLKYTFIGADSHGVTFYNEEVNEEFYKQKKALQETIDNKQKEIITNQVEYKLPEVIKENTFFDRDCTYDISVDVKYKNIKVTNESTGDVKVFETFGTPRRVTLNKNALTYDDFIDETTSYYNYIVDVNTEAVISRRYVESSHSGDSSIDFPSLDFNLPLTTPAAYNLLSQYSAVRYRVNIDGTLYNGQNTFFPLISSETSLSDFKIQRANYTNFEGKNPTIANYNGDVYLRMVNVGNVTNLKDSFIDSTLPMMNTTSTNISRNYDSSNSAWSTNYSEGYVMDSRITSTSFDGPSNNWELRVGKGGQIYSLKTEALGETVPPQYRGDDSAPWVDEVWQAVSVYNLGANPKFNHGSGVYLKDPILTKPYYTPRLATEIDADDKSFYSMNWMQPSASQGSYDEDNPSHIINLTKYKDVGDGVVEVTLGLYNFGSTEVYRYNNMPWGGVRRTALEYNYLANSDQNSYTQVTGYFGESGAGSARLEDIDTTGGWTVFCSQSAGDYGESLGFVFGQVDAINSDTFASSRIRQGYAYPLSPQPGETDWRNYMVSTVNRRHNINQGKGIWSRFYFVFGNNRADVRDKILSRSLVGNTPYAEMNNLESDSTLIGYKLSLTDNIFSIEKSTQPDFYLYEQLINNAVPVFEIVKNDGTKYVTWDPYTSGTFKMYDGTVQVINLLGFALRTADATGPYTYDTLDNIFVSYSSYYNAGGESLSVRV